MSSMWNVSEFTQNTTRSAKNIVEEQCRELSNATQGKVVGVIRPYEGKYKSGKYTMSESYLATVQAMAQLGKAMTEDFNVQNVLGNQGDGGEFVYEFYITSKATPNYKYRVFLLYFDSRLYPVGLAIEQSVADEIQSGTEIVIESEDAFSTALAGILGSSTVSNVIKNLLSF